MATQAPNNLPLLYRGLEPLNRQAHGDKKVRRLESIPAVKEAHAVPVTVDEFMLAPPSGINGKHVNDLTENDGIDQTQNLRSGCQPHGQE